MSPVSQTLLKMLLTTACRRTTACNPEDAYNRGLFMHTEKWNWPALQNTLYVLNRLENYRGRWLTYLMLRICRPNEGVIFDVQLNATHRSSALTALSYSHAIHQLLKQGHLW